MEVTVSVAEQLGLLPEEFANIRDILGRVPNFTELSVFSVMWSEHCSYKNSIILLKTLPNKGEKVLAGAGEEGAGLMDIGDGWAVAFKIESHNHPSAIEPYQGAATGVGGIHRDIFSLGARPIASLNSLRFGELSFQKTRHLLKGVVKGIGDYGNAFGVPTVGGEIDFDPCYHTNPLVNAMSVGIVERGKSATATAKGVGNPVFIVGSATGKDGIHGATFASEDISDESENKLPSVQVGDPFAEKLLLEATLEALDTHQVIGVQDMGAAGITCATCEMSAKGNVGMDVYLDRVPKRQSDMKPFEILLSESQERMLLVINKGSEQHIKHIFSKWDLECEHIGVVTDSGNMRYFMDEELVAEIPAQSLVLGGGAPVYTRDQIEPDYVKESKKFRIDQITEPNNHNPIIQFLLGIPSIASKQWITEQYDSMVGVANTSTNIISDAAVIRVIMSNSTSDKDKALVLTTDCNSRYVQADPERGTMLAVAEAARNIVCAGGKPLGVTNCLNFGNPYNPEVYWQFAQAIKGMGEACRQFQTPVTGGNVSFYNQSEDGPVYPTPTIGMVGLMDNIQHQHMRMDFSAEGDSIYLLGKVVEDIGSSAYLYHYHKVKNSPAPYIDLEEESLLQQTILGLIEHQLIHAAHDISDGGLIVSLFESAFPMERGFSIKTPENIRKDAFLYGEAGGRAIVSVPTDKEVSFNSYLTNTHLPYTLLGKVTEKEVYIDDENMGNIGDFKSIYDHSIGKIMSA